MMLRAATSIGTRAGAARTGRKVMIGALFVASLGGVLTVGGELGRDRSHRAGASTCTDAPADVVVNPGQDIAAVAANMPEDARIRIAPGIYRSRPIRPKRGQQFFGSVGARCERATILNGSKLITNWVPNGNLWTASGHAETVAIRTIKCTDGFARCNHPQDLFLDHKPLRHVGTLSNMRVGKFWFFDYETNTLHLGVDPTGRRLELATWDAAFLPTAGGVRISGLVIEKYASQSQFGAVGRSGGSVSGWTIDDNEVRLNHGAGIVAPRSSTITGNHVHDNGQLGMKLAANTIAAGNVISYNNYAKYLRSFEAGGVKSSATGLTVAGNCVHRNDGNGLWSDMSSSGVVYDGNTVFRNWGQGIMAEISSDVTIRNNALGYNGNNASWLYGAQIMLSTTNNSLVHDNIVEVPPRFGNGITIVWQNRPPAFARDNVVRNNDVTFLGDAGVSGMRTDFTGGDDVYSTSVFRDNRYHTGASGVPDHFANRSKVGLTLPQTKAENQEMGSTIDTAVTARRWECVGFDAVTRK